MNFEEMRGIIVKQIKSPSGNPLDVIQVQLVEMPEDGKHVAVPLIGVYKYVDWDAMVGDYLSPVECVLVKVTTVREEPSYILKQVDVV